MKPFFVFFILLSGIQFSISKHHRKQDESSREQMPFYICVKYTHTHTLMINDTSKWSKKKIREVKEKYKNPGNIELDQRIVAANGTQ